MNNIKDSWDQIKEKIADEYGLSDVSYSTWIEPLKIGPVTDDSVTILIPSDQSHALNYISSKYKGFFQVTISEMFDRIYEINFRLEKDSDLSNVMRAGQDPVYNLNYETANLNPKYKFNSFVVGGSNKLAHSACLAVAESPGQIYNPLFLYGGAGLGKTHLMHSIGHFILENNPNAKILYVTSEQFTNEVIDSIRSGNPASTKKLRDKYRYVDVLIIDDIQFIIGKESTQEEFFNTFNTLHQNGKQIILSSDKPPKEMETLDERFRSRFGMGLIADIQPPDYETRMAILAEKAKSIGRDIDEEVFNYIATNIKSNIRELEGAFNKIVAYSKLNNVDINMTNAEEALKDIIYPDKPKEITPSYILKEVCDDYNVLVEDVTGKKRNAKFVEPRFIVMYLCRELTDASLSDIGKLLSNRDHTTIMHGVNDIEERIKSEEELSTRIKSIKSRITES
ncbi:MAG: chromosomal replication initiator protein DnaA [Lachnospiraceae bacterium]|nr:chromosomal replication initiator protein DnaA [Lachnospiraceae bacterium]